MNYNRQSKSRSEYHKEKELAFKRREQMYHIPEEEHRSRYCYAKQSARDKHNSYTPIGIRTAKEDEIHKCSQRNGKAGYRANGIGRIAIALADYLR